MYISIIVALIILVAIPISNVFASDFIASQRDRPTINPDFDPDEDCLFDAYLDKCVPGSSQECPDGFGSNEDSTCIPKHNEEGCPEGYHSTEGDETGQCYPNGGEFNGGCEYDMLLTKSKFTGADICVDYRVNCDLNPDHKLCNGEERSDGLQICDKPDHPGYKFCFEDNLYTFLII